MSMLGYFWRIFGGLAFLILNAPTGSALNSTVTTLSPELKLVHKPTVLALALSLTLGIPLLVLLCCAIRSIAAHRREKKITGDDDKNFIHPPPSNPPPRSFLSREGTIAGPFSNPAFDDNADDADRRSGMVTPSFISTRVVGEPGFGMPPKRYQYIP